MFGELLRFHRGNYLYEYVNSQVMKFGGKGVKVMNRVEINIPLRLTLCCGNTVKFVIFVKSRCLNFMTDGKNNMEMVVERLRVLGFQITTLETCY